MRRRMLFVAAALVATSWSAARADAPPTPLPRPFGGAGASFHSAPVAPYSFVDTILRLQFDFERGVVEGHQTAIVRAKHPLAMLPFDSLGIDYESIRVDGKPALYSLDQAAQRVNVRLPVTARAGASLRVDFVYRARPQAGMYFVRPNAEYPHIAPQIWTQGEPADNRRWFPTWDQPNEKTPSELIVSVPAGWTVVGNGYLASHRRSANVELWDWRAPRPKAPYLIAFVAGPLSRRHTQLGRLDVDAFVPPAYADQNATCLGGTNRIVDYFAHLIGAPLPWEKYDQMAAERYIFGGMEDTSATILTTKALHPRNEDVERSCDALIAHELAQQ